MPPKINRPPPAAIPLYPRRLRAALTLHGLTLERLAQRCGVTCSHLGRVVIGERIPSAELLAKVRAEVGEPGWLFATGQADTLRDEGADDVSR